MEAARVTLGLLPRGCASPIARFFLDFPPFREVFRLREWFFARALFFC